MGMRGGVPYKLPDEVVEAAGTGYRAGEGDFGVIHVLGSVECSE
jgi:hypothetical protein